MYCRIGLLYILEKSREEKIKKQLKELENKELVTRLENEMLQNNCFKVELEYKDRELASNSLIIMEKNQVLKSLVDELEKEKMPEIFNRTRLCKLVTI